MTQINLTSPADITLKTAGKYCEDDIAVVQNLEEISAEPTEEVQEFVPSEGKSGISKFTIQPVVTEHISVKSSEEERIVYPSEGKYISSASVLPIKLQSKTITENGKVVADEGFDGLKELEVNVAGSGGGTNGLQWKCDNMNTLRYEFDSYAGESVDGAFEGLDTSNVTNIENCFSRCKNLKSIPMFDTSNVTTTAQAFQHSSALTEIPLLNTSKVTNMSEMFYSCSALLKVPAFDTGNVTTMSSMFRSCSALTEVPLFNTSNVTQLYATFQYCKSLAEPPAFDTSKVTNMGTMFYGCTALTDVPLYDTSKVTNMSEMFCDCTALTDVPELDTSKVTNFSSTFYNCSSLITIHKLNLISATYLSGMLDKCTNLTNLTLKNIKKTLRIGSGTLYGHLLTVDSLVNTIKELWDYSSETATYKLTMGATNLAKLTDVYVKLVDVTDEMLANDPYADQKKPCVVCESTDEGAMTITEYATSKKWQLE